MPLTNPRPRKRQKTIQAIVIKETWTHDFFLLASPNTEKTPTLAETNALLQAGMGRKRVVFKDKQGSFAHIKDMLEREFPKLKTQNGAFEFMRADRGGACRPLLAIPMHTVGYTIPFLRDAVGSGVIYVRPIQCDLSLDKDNSPSTFSSEDAVMTQCINCNKSVPIHSLRDHTVPLEDKRTTQRVPHAEPTRWRFELNALAFACPRKRKRV